MNPSPNNTLADHDEQMDLNLFQVDLPVVIAGQSSKEIANRIQHVRRHLALLSFQAMVLTLKETWPKGITGVRLYYLRPSDSSSSGLNVRVIFPPEIPHASWTEAEETVHQCLEPFFKNSDADFQHMVAMAFSNREVNPEDLDGLLDAALAGDPRLSQVRATRLALQLQPASPSPKGPRL